MGMPSAQVQSGTQPQGKGFSQPVNPPAPMMGASSKIGRLPPMISDELAAPAVMPEQQQFSSQMMGGAPFRTKQMPDAQGQQISGLTVEPDSNFGYQSQAGYQPQQQSRGKGGSTTNSATSGQPMFGQPNRYPNTTGQWDNASIQRQSPTGGGKGKG
jgi:hypothetical protein